MHHRLCALFLLALSTLACSLDRGGIAALASDAGAPPIDDAGSPIDPPAIDAGAPPPIDACGDGVCAPSERCDACADDCGACPPPPPPPVDDLTPPTFDGAGEVETLSRTECLVSWEPASDDTTPSEAIVYEVHVTPRGMPFDFAAPTAVTAPGATSHVVVVAMGRAEIVVRAVDSAGNRDANVRKRGCDPR